MKNILLITLVAGLTTLAASAEASSSFRLDLGFLFPPQRTVVYQPAPVVYAPPAPAYCPAPAPAYYPTESTYIAPPYPCQVIPVGYNEVQVIYFSGGYRHSAYFPRTVWAREGWGAWRHERGYRR